MLIAVRLARHKDNIYKSMQVESMICMVLYNRNHYKPNQRMLSTADLNELDGFYAIGSIKTFSITKWLNPIIAAATSMLSQWLIVCLDTLQ